MRSFFIGVVIAMSACTLPAAEPNALPSKASVSGLWLGVMQVGPVHLRMAFSISNTTGGKISGKLLSLDQNGAEAPCKSFSFDANKLTIEMPAISAKYSGELAADGNSIAGEFIQLDNRMALNLKRIDKLPTLNRPQHPKKPIPTVKKTSALGIRLQALSSPVRSPSQTAKDFFRLWCW
jgi:hypothetical protein